VLFFRRLIVILFFIRRPIQPDCNIVISHDADCYNLETDVLFIRRLIVILLIIRRPIAGFVFY